MNIFEKIITREIPSDIVYEDEMCLAFRDVNPQAPVHVLIIPKMCVPSTNDITADNAFLVSHIFAVIPKLAAQLGLTNGYRVVNNRRRRVSTHTACIQAFVAVVNAFVILMVKRNFF